MAYTTAIPMHIATVCQTSPTESGMQRYVVVLDEEDGGRRLPIWVGEHEGIALAFALEGVPLPRPMTYQLTAALLQAAGSHITGVLISALTDGAYYATISLDTPAGRKKVDARPSDAMILAMLSDAQVMVEAAVLNQALELHKTTLPSVDDVEREALAQARQIVAARVLQMEQQTEEARRRYRP
ncbi:MAG: bifunctional nuclease family protein [Nitriliruptorales bacterium]